MKNIYQHLEIQNEAHLMTDARSIRLIIFDMDGTLTVPYLDFHQIRKVIGVPEDGTLTLDYMMSLEGQERERAFEIMQQFEDDAAYNAELQPGVLTLLEELRRRAIVTAVQTRNSRRSVDIVIQKFGIHIDHIFTRDNAEPKPDPGAINSLLGLYGISGEQAVMVGDFWPDVETGRNAGIKTVLLKNDLPLHDKLIPDAEIDELTELVPLLDKWSETE
jgi:HAD superfamily hydrolase (TIGR01509 family)